MSRTGKWNAVQEVDSRQLANVPMVPSNDFEDEIDMNPSAPRRPFWMDRNYVRSEERQSFTRDTDTVDEDWCLKETIVGAVIERKPTGDYTKWSIVVRTVIRWEERAMSTVVVFNKTETDNRRPADVERAQNNGRFKTRISSRRNNRRIRK
tara:strand:- start:1444 stop:1896 length:453 start_codon:yes stop_codon:yes gene_type:complete